MPGAIARWSCRTWPSRLRQRLSLQQFLQWNDTEANRNYHYNYYLDNCSTRVRDALDNVLGGQIERTFGTVPSGHTWRWETRRILGWDLPLYTGIMLALGHPVDREMTAWQAMFLPLRLHEALQSVKVADSTGAMVPLVRANDVLQRSTRFPTRTPQADLDSPADHREPWRYGADLARCSGARLTRRPLGVRPAGGGMVAGGGGARSRAAGTLVPDGSLGCEQERERAARGAISLVLVVLIPMALSGRVRAGVWARRVAGFVTGLAVLALLIKVLPWFRQYNLELIGLILPIHLGVLFGLRHATAAR